MSFFPSPSYRSTVFWIKLFQALSSEGYFLLAVDKLRIGTIPISSVCFTKSSMVLVAVLGVMSLYVQDMPKLARTPDVWDRSPILSRPKCVSLE